MHTASTTVTAPAPDGDDPLCKASTSAMHDSPIETARATWAEANALGLAHGAAGDWPGAYAAFSDAAGALLTETDTTSREALAVVHNNLAHASFRLGRADEALRHAQSVYDLRVALAGDDSIAVARVRSDLAVMLCRTGRFAEAQEVIGGAIQGVQRAAGDEDERLIPLLETSARIAMAAGQPANAEPMLLRLHALQSEHQQSTATSEALLARVARARNSPNATPVSVTPLPFTPVSAVPIVATPTHAPLTPLRAAPASAPHAGLPAVGDPEAKDTSPLAMIGFDFELADDPRKAPAPPISPAPKSPLGFDVEYGTPQEPIIPNFETMEAGPLLAPPIRTSLLGSSGSRRTPVVVPTPTRGNQAVVAPNGSRRVSVSDGPRAPESRVAEAPMRDAVVVDSRAKARNGRAVAPRTQRGFLIALAIAAAATAAAYGWFVVLPRG